MNAQIENKLIEITNSLIEIDSARNQVVAVTESSQAVIEQNIKLIKLFEELNDIIEDSLTNTEQVISQKQVSMELALENWENEFTLLLNDIRDRNNSLVGSLISIRNQYIYGLEESRSKLEDSINTFESLIKDAQKVIKNLQTTMKEIILDEVNNRIYEMETKTLKHINNNNSTLIIGFSLIAILLIVLIALQYL